MILYCVIHTINQQDREYNILSTWGKHKDIIFYSDHEDLTHKVYKVSDNNSYSSGQEKQIKVFELLKHQFSNYDWYIFVDNDTFINTYLLEQDITTFDHTKIHGFIKNDRKLYSGIPHPSGGAGFVIHRTNMTKIWNHRFDLVSNLIWGDVAIGLLAKDLDIEFQNHNTKFNMYPPYRYKYNVNQCYSFHYIKDHKTMKKLYEICTNI